MSKGVPSWKMPEALRSAKLVAVGEVVVDLERRKSPRDRA